MDGQYGVKESKEFFDLGFATAKAGVAITEDGKLDLNDLGHLMVVLPKVESGVKGMADIPKELGELSEDEEKELLDHARTQLPQVIADEQLRQLVSTYVRAGLGIAAAISASVQYFGKPEAVPAVSH